MTVGRTIPRAAREPWPYFGLAFLLAAAGFYPSFFAAIPTLSPAHLIHGFAATAWMLLPLAQGLLIRLRARPLHRAIGWASTGLAALVILSGLKIVQIMAFKNLTDFHLRRVKFVLLDLTGLLLFGLFLALAIGAARRRDIGLHVRLLAATALIPLEAALERLLSNLFPTLVPDFAVALYAALLSMEAIVAGVIVAEWRLGRVRWPMPFLLGYYVTMHVIATPVALTPQFQAFCVWYAHLPIFGTAL